MLPFDDALEVLAGPPSRTGRETLLRFTRGKPRRVQRRFQSVAGDRDPFVGVLSWHRGKLMPPQVTNKQIAPFWARYPE